MVEDTLLLLSEDEKKYIIELRRWFHMHPESSFNEYQTSNKIKEELDNLQISYKSIGKSGIVGVINGKKMSMREKKVIALRADIDALEIEEKNEVEYKSINKGLMHACGHDAHIASLLVAAKILNEEKENFSGVIKLIFQPAEEVGKGAELIKESGEIDDVEAFFGIHVKGDIDLGKIAISKGMIMAGANSLKIIIKGESGHGGKPDEAIDAITAGSAVVGALQQVISREINPNEPVVITIGQFHGGTRDNIIANEAIISGTIRIASEKIRKKVVDAVKRIVKYTSEAYRTKAIVESEIATFPVINDEILYDIAYEAAKTVVKKENVINSQITMETEDFGVYSTIAPVFYAQVGVKMENDQYPHHHERFDINENALPIVSALYIEFVNKYMENN